LNYTGIIIYEAMQEFFNEGKMPQFLRASKLILSSKSDNATLTLDFRLISYCKVLYKCITKVICGIMEAIPPCVINQSQ